MADQQVNQGSGASFFAGLVIGGLTGAAISLLMAPQSGSETRDQLQKKGIQLRDEVTDTAGTFMEQARETGQHVSTAVVEKAGELRQRGEDLLNGGRQVAEALSGKQNNKGKNSR